MLITRPPDIPASELTEEGAYATFLEIESNSRETSAQNGTPEPALTSLTPSTASEDH